MKRRSIALLGLIGTLLTGGASRGDDTPGARSSALPPAARRKVDFDRDILPILFEHCLKCHGPDRQRSDYRVDRRSEALRGGESGEPAIVPGKSADSRLLLLVAGLDPDAVMPPKGPRLDPNQLGLLRAWIDQGAHWAAEGSVSKSSVAENHWSLRPLAIPAVPKPKDEGWCRTPIDRFIRATQEENGLMPAPEADRRTLIRRVTFDLTGLPPTIEEIDAFLSDSGPDPFAKVVDRLLDSARYGERWARHWMDVVHFAETHGNDQDRPRPNAWPYRDYLIRSFNDDKPYARFVQEQIAGDALFPGDPQAIVALGFIAAGPWDESSQRDIRDDTIDKKIAQYLDRDDMVATTMSTFMSATVHCARCHNHKFDPITQEEYYNLQAVFAGVDRAERPYSLDPKAESLRAPLLRRKTALETRQTGVVDALLDAGERARLLAGQSAWESSASASAPWTTLDPSSQTSSGGASPTKLADGSVLYGGTRPDVDTYTMIASTDLKGITAVRLEVLTDESLPQKGPGRQDNGNLHLTEFRVSVAPRSSPADSRPVMLHSAAADFDQAGWTAAMAIDGNPQTAWGIHPEVGKPHQAVFEPKGPIGFEGGTTLTFVLEQNHGRGHLIGRPRLSVTTAARPSLARPLPEQIARILSVPRERRSDAQQAELRAYYYSIAPEITTAIERTVKAIAALPPVPMVYAAAHDFTSEGSFHPAKKPRPVAVLRRGDINSPLQPASPGALGCIDGMAARFSLSDPDDEGGRRAALAHWITDSRNVLTWRSIVNRVWHYHFGRGLSDTPNDLGRMGSPPSHPELLDWLAVTFRDGGGSLKKLHRLLLTSAVYRQTCRHDPEAAGRDADNVYLWRMNRTRLDAESVRDAVLQVSGKLDLTMGGPSVKQFIQSPGIHVTPVVDYLHFDVDSQASYRRSVYRFLFRTMPDPFMDSMDCPDSSQLSPKRNASVTALQALAMLNDHFIVRQSEHFATRVAAMGKDIHSQVEAAYLLALGRSPTAEEVDAVSAYVDRHGLANACRLLLNSNEFMFIN